jgi:hypothetical protein
MTTTVALLTEWIERQFPIGESTSGPLAVTGERYVVVGHMIESPKYPGVIEEGAAPEAGFDEETACMSAASAFRDYAEGRTGTLYWRVKPELSWSSDHRRCMVYMRLLISDKPQGGL